MTFTTHVDRTLRLLALGALCCGLAYLALRAVDIVNSYEFIAGRRTRPYLPPGTSLVAAAWTMGGHLLQLSLPFLIGALEVVVVLDWALWVAVHRARRAPVASAAAPPAATPAGPTPFVTVLIPAADEPDDVLEKTLRAARTMDFSAARCTVMLLDELGSEARRQLVTALDAENPGLPLVYCTRAGTPDARRGYKAGNLNFGVAQAPAHTDAFVLLDADHVPRPHLLRALTPYLGVAQLGFVQAPQTYRTSETDAAPLDVDGWDRPCREFHTVTQAYRAHLDAVMLTGTSALIRAEALRAVGGFDEASVTEDIVTGALMQARGFVGCFHPEPVADGLVPAALHDVLRQRLRWAQGSFQLLRRRGLWRALGGRRALGYASGIAHFLLPITTLAIALLPVLVLWFALDPALHYGTPALCTLLGFALLRHAARERFCARRPAERAASAVLAVVLGPVYLWGLISAWSTRRLAFRTTPKGLPSRPRLLDRVLVAAPVVVALANVGAVISVGRDLVRTGYPLEQAVFDYAGLALLALFFAACGLSVLWPLAGARRP